MRIKLSLLIVILSFASASCTKEGEYSSSVATLGLNFSAKAMCSCLWVSENTEGFCREYAKLKRVSPKISVNTNDKTVKASLFWILSAKAKFINARSGCQLEGKN